MQDKDYIDQEVAGVRFIYETLYPQEPIELHLWWEKSKMATPLIQRQENPLNADMLSQGYLGAHRIGPAPQPGQLGRRICLTIPSPRQIRGRAHQNLPWADRPLHYRLVNSLSPLLGEQGKYLVERRRQRLRPKRHKFARLPLSRTANYLTDPAVAHTTSRKKTPAILIGLHWLDVGGAESLGLNSIQWALDLGLRVFVMVGQHGPERLRAKLPQHPDLHLIRTDRYLPPALVGHFVERLIAQENIILTHNHHCVPLYDALPAIKLRHPHVVNLDSTHIVEHHDGGYPRISGVWSNFLDYHHVISNELLAFYGESFRVYGSKMVLGRLLDDRQRDKTPLPVRLSAGQNTCRITFVGRMVHQKRPLLMLAILRRLHKWGKANNVSFHFDIVGEGAYLEALRHKVARWRLNDCIHLHGAGSDVPALLAKSDIMLLPSSNEGLALVCYEAIAAGCIPISTDVGGQNEICPAETLVPWAPFKTVRETCNLVIRLLRDKGFAQQVERTQNARLQALQNEPSAREVLSRIYAQTLQKTQIPSAKAPTVQQEEKTSCVG
ncbi:Glycosyltransferase involved in cell wall bisynthesis [Epibacterium ulvae]|uniref:Glycosyltransferase involved in cell wall bisynthesis n=1 Tax=Epibacterium ulvae TaxID=1156985 RepID=A0A1G5RCX0_9RHOB|nr:glycosyltransferase family 4 protein [Epibacterium ulvae]SCZ71897.1 Glycosyltransferase involved in cell wall bisynthesis [Epibacterium ulvae]